jgi:MFS family permease
MTACVLFCVVEFWYWTAVLLYTFETHGSTVAGAVLLAQLIPAALLAAPLGVWMERFPRGAALSAAYGVEAIALVALSAALYWRMPLPVVVAASAIVTIVVSVARPIHHAMLPQLAPTPDTLVRANSGTGLAEGIGVFAGPVLAGLVTQWRGASLSPLMCAGLMAAAALLTARLALPHGLREQDDQHDRTGGLRSVLGDRSTVVLLLALATSAFVIGSLELLNVAFADGVLHGGESLAGILIGAAGIGLFAGAFLAAALVMRAKLAPVIVGSLVIGGLPLVVMAWTRAAAPAMVWLVLCGAGLSLASVAARTLLQRTNDGRALGRVFAVQESLMMAGLALGAIVAPAALALAGTAGAYVVVGVALCAVALLTLASLRRLDARADYRPSVLAALRRIHFLARLAPPELEHLSRRAEWLDVPAGTTVIRQGDAGDAFYVISDGRASVRKDGVLLPYELAAGEGFGELALLHDAPRAATISTLVDCRLLRIEREDFLAAVTGVGDGAVIAREVAEAYEVRQREGAP